MNKQYKIWLLKFTIHMVSLGLLIQLYYNAIADSLGADPVEEVLHFTGIGAVNLLFLGLTISPIIKQFKIAWLMQTRRLIGLYAFLYACCHIVSFWAFEVQFDVSLFIAEIIERPYITVGLASFIILTALAVTSLHALKRLMGKRWQRLHNWVYVAGLLAVVHFYWSVKSDLTEPLVYFALLIFLLSFRKHKFFRNKMSKRL